jgi:PhnB protein
MSSLTILETAPSSSHIGLMNGVIPYLHMAGRAAAAADFYQAAFNARSIGRVPNPECQGQYIHLQIEINGGVLMMTDHLDKYHNGDDLHRGIHMQLVVTRGREWWERAILAGCRELLPLVRQPWGDRLGMIEDPFGIRWAILEPADSWTTLS